MTKKIYCYVDETGQDTMGKLFIVVAIVVEKERETLTFKLEKTESRSGKEQRKWFKTKEIERNKYLDTVLSFKELKNKIYYQVFEETKSYKKLMVLVIARAIKCYIKEQKIGLYQATVLIDGLRKTEVHKMSKALREQGVKIRKVKGLKDESEPIIRLADAVAGLVRKAGEGNQKSKSMTREAGKRNVINRLN
jgi:hypothetical protein